MEEKSVVKNNERDHNISLIRVVSMFLIIGTHLIAEIDSIAFLSQLTNSAIYTFLFISGYLFGKRRIQNSGAWIKKRLRRLLVPSYLYLVVLFLFKASRGDLTLNNVLVYLFNLQAI